MSFFDSNHLFTRTVLAALCVAGLGCSSAKTGQNRELASIEQKDLLQDLGQAEGHTIVPDSGDELERGKYAKAMAFALGQESVSLPWWQKGDAAPGSDDPRCAKFDPKTTDPSLFDYRTLANYRQKELTPDDGFGDYTLMVEFQLMVREKLRRILGKTDLYHFIRSSNRDDANRRLAYSCMKLDFPMPPATAQSAPYDLPRLEKAFRAAGISENDIQLALSQYGKIAIYGEKNPYRFHEFTEMLIQVIGEESTKQDQPLLPSSGSPLKWGPTFLKQHPTMFVGSAHVFSKLLVALASGSTSRVMATGKEDELEKWLINQPDRSVYPDMIFRQAYRLQGGDVYLSLLVVENVLSRYFMWLNRSLLVQTNKLAPIMNHLGESVDLYGSYYHLFGTILYGYVAGSLRSNVAAELERGNSLFTAEVSERQETFANVEGNRIGTQLKRRVKRGVLKNWTSDAKRLAPTYYLDHTEDFGPKIRKFWDEHKRDFVSRDQR